MIDARTRLAGMAGAALLLVGVMVSAVRGEATAERYAIARCQAEQARVERRCRAMRVVLVARFARWRREAQGALFDASWQP